MKKRLLGLIVISVIAVGFIIATTNSHTSWNSDANQSNGSTFFGYKGDVYFNNLHEGVIYRLHKDSGKMTEVVEGTFASLQVEDDWIYTRMVLGADEGLYKVKTNGKKTEQLMPLANFTEGMLSDLLDNKPYTKMTKNGDEMYYIDSTPEDGGIYKMHLKTGERVKLTDNNEAKYFYVFDDWLYYLQSERSKISRVRIDGSEQEYLTTETTPFMMMDSEWIYYLSEGTTIKRISHDGQLVESIKYDYTRWIQYMNIHDDWIYASALVRAGHNVSGAKDQGHSSWELYKINASTKKRVDLYVGEAKNIHIIDDHIYFYGDTSYHRMKLDGTDLTELTDIYSRSN